MYIDEMGGLWLTAPGGLLLGLAAFGLVIWAQSGMNLGGLVRLLSRQRSQRSGRHRGGYAGRPFERRGRLVVGPRLSRTAPSTLVTISVRGAAQQPVQWRRLSDERNTDLLPVA